MGKCPFCAGRGYNLELDVMRATRVQVKCKPCNGIGDTIEKITDGVMVGRLMCETFLFVKKVADQAVATLELRVYMCLKDGKPYPSENSNIAGARIKPAVYGEIPRMATFAKHRGKGYMSELIECAKGDPAIQYIVTSWDDSTEQGRAFLLKRGFENKHGKLVWRREKTSPVADGTPVQ